MKKTGEMRSQFMHPQFLIQDVILGNAWAAVEVLLTYKIAPRFFVATQEVVKQLWQCLTSVCPVG